MSRAGQDPLLWCYDRAGTADAGCGWVTLTASFGCCELMAAAVNEVTT